MTNDNMPCLDENYATAVCTSNMRVHVDRKNVADVLIASGMSRSRTGAALMRLRTEYGSHSVPRSTATATDHKLTMLKLRSLDAVLKQVIWQANKWRVDRPEAVALAVIAHYLDDICQHCEGRGKEKIKDSPATSNKNCKHCQGTGRTRLPHGEAGRMMREYLDACVSDWRGGTSAALWGR